MKLSKISKNIKNCESCRKLRKVYPYPVTKNVIKDLCKTCLNELKGGLT